MPSASAVLRSLRQRPNLPDGIKDEITPDLGAIALTNGDGMAIPKADSMQLPQKHRFTQIVFSISWNSPVPGVCTASTIDPSVSRKTIVWSEHSKKWTQSRHYAVPAYDIPVHTMEEPLLSWLGLSS